MPIQLVVTSGPQVGQRFVFSSHDTFLVGRSARAHFSLPDDPYFSRMHFLVEVNPPLCRLLDLGSRSGTLVNGERVQTTALKHGDEIRGGQTTLRVLWTEEEPATIDCPPKRDSLDLPSPTVSPLRRDGSLGRTGRSFPGYEVLGRLGAGAMGIVYRARRERDGVETAIKCIHPDVATNPRTVSRFLREVSILQQLRHPHIVEFHESGECSAGLYFVMELVVGVNADKLIRQRGPLPMAEAIALVLPVLDALGYAHGRGFVHRDIKPSNLLVAPGPLIKLADFGLARLYQDSPLSGLTISGCPGGTPRFMPPEHLTAFRLSQPTSDQYSLAATLYHLLTAAHAHDGRDASEIFCRMLTVDPAPIRQRRPDLPAGLADAIHRALARLPEDRFPDVGAFAVALRPFA